MQHAPRSPIVTAMRVRVVENRMRMTRSQGSGSMSGKLRRVIVRIDTDGGIRGYGEAAPWTVFSGTVEAAAAALHVHLRPLVIGREIGRIAAIVEAADTALHGHPEAKAALEMALFDASGKALGVPIHALMGGAVCTTIPLSFSLANPDLDADLTLATDMAGSGINIFKVKTGFLDHRTDMHRLERIRAKLGDATDLRIDYNQALAPISALSRLRAMEQFDLTFIEQPIPARYPRAMAALTDALDTPILADESVFSPEDALAAAQCGLADGVSIKLMKSGGMLKARAIAAIATAAGMPCYGGTLWEGAIGLTAAAHLIAATPAFTLGCEFYMPRYVFLPEQAEAAMTIRDGQIVVPTGPGLGIAIDEDILDRITVESFD
ncbi:MAG: cycloisomerase [Alphaproteobacteria bacterium]|nr:cycloisomerase [Alphaproteobacteria bacterium]